MSTRPMRWLIAVLAMSLLTACSRTVTWEEEVPLNTGEVIWVERSVEYSIQGDAGNPMDLAWRPNKKQVLEFEWKGKKYRYEGDACLQVLAIRNDLPVLIGDAWCQGLQWTHKYDPCEAYVQLSRSQSSQWESLPKPEDWVYGLRTNLLIDFTYSDRLAEKITTARRVFYETKDPRGRSQLEIIKIKPEAFDNPQCRKGSLQ